MASVTAELKEQSLQSADTPKKEDDNKVAAVYTEKEPAGDDTTKDSAAENALQGESLLLPLLQGLLHKKAPPRLHLKINKNSNSAAVCSSENAVQITSTGGLHIEDSGTESGEDLKLLAAGLHDHFEMQRNPNADGDLGKGYGVRTDLLAEVTSALDRLHSSLVDGSDIELDTIRRNALLSLVSRLQTGLLAPEKITTNGIGSSTTAELSSPEVNGSQGAGARRSSGHGRFAKRKNRQNRHTVGVSQEELADARRYIEELVMIESLSNSGTPETLTPPSINSTVPYTLQKQSSAGAVISAPSKNYTPLFRPNVFVPHDSKEPPPLPQPNKLKRNQSTETNPTTAAPPQPAVVQLRERKPKYKFTRQSLSFDQTANEIETSRRPFSEFDLKSTKVVQKAVQRVNAGLDAGLSSEDEHDATRKSANPKSQNRNVLEKNFYNKIHHSAVVATKPDLNKQVRQQTNNSLFNGLQKAAYRSRTPPGKTYEEDVTTASGGTQQTRIGNKFNNKKLKMKRANTIDIPKAFKFPDDDTEDDDGMATSQEESTIGLKGTIQAGARVAAPKKVVPQFTPKTENDHKFLAFIQKQNDNNCPSWINPNKGKSSSNKHNWNNAFGNIKKTFENAPVDGVDSRRKPPMVNVSAAKQFWKQSEVPTISHANKFVPKANPVLANVVINNTDRMESKTVEPISPKIVVPKPIPVNEFSHAPMSAFQPIVRNVEKIVATFKPIKAPEPKSTTNGYHDGPTRSVQQKPSKAQPSPTRNIAAPMIPPYQTHQITSPTGVGIPWANRVSSDHRVLNLVAAKFDNIRSPPNVALAPVGIPIKSNRMFSSPNLTARSTGVRLQQKRGSLPNDSTYSYFNDGLVPNMMETQQNTFQNENLYYAPPVPIQNHQYNYNTQTSLPNLSNYRSEPSRHHPQQQMYRPSKYNLPPAQPHYYTQPTNYYALPEPAIEQRYRHHPSPTHSLPAYVSAPPPPQTLQQQQHQYQRPLPPQTQNYQTYKSNPPSVSNEFPAYPYTCTDYTQPACISTYIPKVTVTRDRTHSITSPSGEPLVLSNTRPIISPNSHPELLKCFDYPSSSDNSPLSTSVSPHTLNDPLDDEINLPDMQEYVAAKTQVMKGPVSQTAVTVASKVSSRGGGDDDGKESQAAKSLHSVLKGIKNRSPDPRSDIINKYAQDVRAIAKKTYSKAPTTMRQDQPPKVKMTQPNVVSQLQPHKIPPYKPPSIIETPSTPMAVQKSEMPSHIVYNHVPETMPYHMNINDGSYPYYNQSIETRANGETVLTGNFRIPVSQQHYQPTPSSTTMYTNDSYHAPSHHPPHYSPQHRRSPVTLSKSDSWTQICAQATNKPTTNGTATDGKALQRTKSGHTLMIPKQFEAGIKKIEAISDKQRTVAAYFSGQKSPQSLSRSSSQQNITDSAQAASSISGNTSKSQYASQQQNTSSTVTANGTKRKSQITRIKTSEKASINKQVPSSGIARSHTMPYMANLNLLDESNVEDAFENLFNSSMA